MSQSANINLAQFNNQIITDSLAGDLMFYTSTSNQSYLFGTSNNAAYLRLSQSNITVNGNINVNKGLQMPGISLTLGGFATNSTSALYATTSNLLGYSNQAWTGSNGVQLNVPGTSNDKISFAGNSGSNEVFSVTGDGTINFANRLNMNGIMLTQRQSSNVNNLSISSGVVKSVAGDTQISMASTSNSILFLQGATEAMRISSNTYVGIAKSNPAYSLDVTGDINFTGNLRKGGLPLNAYIVLSPSTSRTYSQNSWQVMSLGSVSRSNNSTLWTVSPTATGLDTLTINTTGLYQISMRIFVGGGTLSLRYGFVTDNATPSDSVYDQTLSVGANNIASCVFTKYFNAGNVLRFIFNQQVSSATTTNLSNNSYGQNDITITFLSP